MLFECAIALSDVINQKTGYQISEHEAAYIALHIGSLLTEHHSMRDKVICVLLFPPYYDYGEKLISQLTDFFGSSLVFQGIITHTEELAEINKGIDLVISIIHVQNFYKTEFVSVSPFMTSGDFNAVLGFVEKIKQKKKKTRLFEQLQQISNPVIFFRDIHFNNETETIKYLSQEMIQNGYAEETFCDEVLKRESSYSTAYGIIAVPHSMRMSAKKTGMAILINEKPIPWGNHEVNIVLLFSVRKETRNLFYDIFDNLIVLLLETSNAEKIKVCKTYDEFIESIINCL